MGRKFEKTIAQEAEKAGKKMIAELTRAELIRVEKYLSDEKKEHPKIWRALIEGIKSGAAKVRYQVTKKEIGLLKKVLAIKNPMSSRTKALRAAGAIRPDEWLGGNKFHHRKPKETFFEKAERYGGQIRSELKPGKKKECIALPIDSITLNKRDIIKLATYKTKFKKKFEHLENDPPQYLTVGFSDECTKHDLLKILHGTNYIKKVFGTDGEKLYKNPKKKKIKVVTKSRRKTKKKSRPRKRPA